MDFDLNSESCPSGTRFIYKIRDENQNSWRSKVYEDVVVEWAPSGVFVKCRSAGWRSVDFFSFFEVLPATQIDEPEMCPNCVTPWKCNGPHTFKPADPSEQEFPLTFHKEETG